MGRNKGISLLSVLLLLFFGIIRSDRLSAQKNKKLTVEEVVARHLQSIGPPGLLRKIYSRAFKGVSSCHFIQGMSGRSDGEFIFASAANKLGILIKYNDLAYPGEYLAFDGNAVTVGNMSPGQKSPLADFIFRYNGTMKEGLLAGVLSVSWPLLDIEKNKPNLKYKVGKIGGRRLHTLEYVPQKSSRDLRVKMYFDFETFRHVRTEYRVRVRDDSSTIPEGDSRRRSVGISRYPGGSVNSEIFDAVPDSIYLLIEKFDDFNDYGGLMLPSRYSLEFSIEGQGSSFLADWVLKAGSEMVSNSTIRDDFFRAQH